LFNGVKLCSEVQTSFSVGRIKICIDEQVITDPLQSDFSKNVIIYVDNLNSE